MPHHDDQTLGRIEPVQQPQAKLLFSEYELQVLETITQHAIDEGAIRSDLVEVVASVQRKVVGGRADLRLARRRLAVEQANKRHEQTKASGDADPSA